MNINNGKSRKILIHKKFLKMGMELNGLTNADSVKGNMKMVRIRWKKNPGAGRINFSLPFMNLVGLNSKIKSVKRKNSYEENKRSYLFLVGTMIKIRN